MTNSDAPDGSVRISPQQVYSEVLGMKDGLTRVEGLLERHIAVQEQTNASLREDVKEHGVRISDHDSEIVGIKTRLTAMDIDFLVMKEAASKRESRKAPWWSIVAAVGTIITVGFLIVSSLAQYQQQIAFLERIAP